MTDYSYPVCVSCRKETRPGDMIGEQCLDCWDTANGGKGPVMAAATTSRDKWKLVPLVIDGLEIGIIAAPGVNQRPGMTVHRSSRTYALLVTAAPSPAVDAAIAEAARVIRAQFRKELEVIRDT